MGAIPSQITSLTIVYSTVYSDADQRKHHSSASLAFVRGIHRGPVNFPHKWPVTRKMFPFEDVIMASIPVIKYVKCDFRMTIVVFWFEFSRHCNVLSLTQLIARDNKCNNICDLCTLYLNYCMHSVWFLHIVINSLWPGESIWWHISAYFTNGSGNGLSSGGTKPLPTLPSKSLASLCLAGQLVVILLLRWPFLQEYYTDYFKMSYDKC